MPYKIRIEGIEAYCFDLIVDEENSQNVYFLSLAGYQTAVKGILANFLKGESLAVDIRRTTHWIGRLPGSHLMRIKKLPSHYCHGKVLARMNDSKKGAEQPGEFLLISKDPAKVKDQFYSCLDTRTEVPLNPSWADWLWRLFEANDWISPLKTLAGRHKGYLISMHQGELVSAISQAIQLKVPEILACMGPDEQIGGGNGNNIKPENLS